MSLLPIIEFTTAVKSGDVASASSLLQTNPELLRTSTLENTDASLYKKYRAPNWLHLAVEAKQLKMAEFLLNFEADHPNGQLLTEGRNAEQEVPLFLALKNEDMVSLLLRFNPNVMAVRNDQGYTIFHCAVINQASDFVLHRLYLEFQDVVLISNSKGRRPIDTINSGEIDFREGIKRQVKTWTQERLSRS